MSLTVSPVSAYSAQHSGNRHAAPAQKSAQPADALAFQQVLEMAMLGVNPAAFGGPSAQAKAIEKEKPLINAPTPASGSRGYY